MKIEIQAGQAELLEKIIAEANAQGQPLNELEERCLRIALDQQRHKELAQIEREFPSKEAYDEFVARAARLIERTILHEAETRPELTPQARASLEKFLSGRGEAVVSSVFSMAMFGRMPPVLRAVGTAVLILPLAAIAGWQLYAELTGGRMTASSRLVFQAALALLIAAAIWSVLNVLKKLGER